MWKLFKETLKSFSKNKVILIGLSILIFLSSGVFSLLYEVKESYKNQLNDYNRISRVQDVTVDLDLDNEGILYHDGFNLRNMEVKDNNSPSNVLASRDNFNEYIFASEIKAKGNKVPKALNPVASLHVTSGKKDSVQDFISISDNFKDAKMIADSNTSLTNFKTIEKEEFSNVFLNSGDFQRIYDDSRSKHLNANLSLNGAEFDLETFKFKINSIIDSKDYPQIFFDTYERVIEPDGSKIFVLKTISPQINNNQDYKFVKQYQLSDLIKIDIGKKIDGGQQTTDTSINSFAPLYLNVATKQASIEIKDRNTWNNDGFLFEVGSLEVAKMLGFNNIDKNPNKDKDINKKNVLISLNEAQNATLSSNGAFSHSPSSKKIQIDTTKTIGNNMLFRLSKTFEPITKKNVKVKAWFRQDESFSFNKSWVEKTINRIYCRQKIYDTSFSEKTRKKFSNDFVKFYDRKVKEGWQNDEDYKIITFWDKVQRRTIIKNVLDENGFIEEVSVTEEIALPITIEDLKVELIKLPMPADKNDLTKYFGINQYKNQFKNDYFFNDQEKSNNTNIIEVENQLKTFQISENPISEHFDAITNPNIKNTASNKIRTEVASATNASIFKTINKHAGNNNLGIRQTLSAKIIGENSESNQIYHFVNTGSSSANDPDERYYIKGQKQNVGKLFNETISSSQLNSISTELDENYNSDKIPIFYIVKVIKTLLDGLSTDKDYLDVQTTFGDFDVTVNKNVNKFLNKKIVLIDSNSSSREHGLVLNGVIENGERHMAFLVKSGTKWSVSPGSTKEFDFSNIKLLQLSSFLKTNNLNLKYKLGKKDSWFIRDNNRSNKFFIPFKYINLRSSIIEEASKKQELNSLFSIIENTLYESQLFKDGFWSSSTIRSLSSGIQKGMKENNFAHVILQGTTNSSKIIKALLDSLYIISQDENEQAVKNIFVEPLMKIRSLIGLQGGIKEQRRYVDEQLRTLSSLLKRSLGFDFYQMIEASIPIRTFLKYIKSPTGLIDSFIGFINAINFTGAFTDLKKWYNDHYNKKDEMGRRYYFSYSEFILPLIENWNQLEIQTALHKMVDQIDFKEVFKTDENDKTTLFYNLTKDIEPQFRDGSKGIIETYRNIFKKIGADEQYSNLNKGIKDLISLVDQRKFIDNIKEPLERNKVELTLEDEHGDSVKFIAKTISNLDLLASFVKSISSNDFKLKNSLVKMLNLSRKGQNTKIIGFDIFVPGTEKNKLDASDLLNLEVNSYDTINKYKKKSELLETIKLGHHLFQDKLQISDEEKAFLLNIVGVKNETLLDKAQKDILYHKLKTFFKVFNNFVEINKIDGYNNKVKKILDIAKDPNLSNVITAQGFNSVKDTIALDPNAASIYNSFIVYNYWIQKGNDLWKQIPENQHLTDLEIKQKFQKFQKFLKALFELSNDKEIQKKLSSFTLYGGLANNNFGIAGLDKENTQAPVAFLQPGLTADDLFELRQDNTHKVEALNILKKNNSEIFEIILKNKPLLVSELGKIITNKEYREAIDNFLKSFLTEKIINAEELGIIARTADSFTGQSTLFLSLGIPPVFSSSYLGTAFAKAALWYSTAPGNIDPSTSNQPLYNLEYLIQMKVTNFQNLHLDQIKKIFKPIAGDFGVPVLLESFAISSLALDMDYVYYIESTVLKNDEELFGLNTHNIFFGDGVLFKGGSTKGIVGSLISENIIKEKVVFSDSASYIAKVNQSWLNLNKKNVYTGTISTNPAVVEELMENLDPKYILDTNGSKFIIIGVETTADYLYPVISEDNLQVNTKNQALVYVNQNGFDRMRLSSPESIVKTYVLVKNGSEELTNEELSNQINQSIKNQGLSNSKKAYTSKELDPVNPERSLRISVVDGIISSINTANFYIVLIFLILVAAATIFISNKYVANRKKVIGILIAQGYLPLQIALSFTAFALFTSLIGGLIGYLTGHFTQIPLMNAFSSYWTLPNLPIKFSLLSLFISVLLPFLGMSFIIVMTTLYALRSKPVNLLTGVDDLKVGKIAKSVSKIFIKFNVKVRFVVALIINSFWKLGALLITLTLVSFVTLFSVSTNNIFNNAVNKTYKNRSYEYKINLETPTTEGGLYTTYNGDDLTNALFVPLGTQRDGEVYRSDYFKPGISSVANNILKNDGRFVEDLTINGNPNVFPNKIFTKSSIDVTIEAGLVLNPWEITYNSLPDSQRTRAVNQTLKVVKLMQETQNLKIDDRGNIYKGTIENPEPYFRFIQNGKSGADFGKFFYFGPLKNSLGKLTTDYQSKLVKTTGGDHKIRDLYRAFLADSYSKIKENDYFVAYGSLFFDDKQDELYTHSKIQNQADESFGNIYGYSSKSEQIKLVSKHDQNLSQTLNQAKVVDGKYPLVINHTVSKKYKLNKGSEVNLKLFDHVDRFKHKFLQEHEEKVVETKFYVLDINETYINDEYITRQNFLNDLIGLSDLAKRYNAKKSRKASDNRFIPFNGVFSKSQEASQIIKTTSIYSKSGYWPASFLIKPNNLEDENIRDIANNVFGPQGACISNGFSEKEVLKFANASILDSQDFSSTIQYKDYDELVRVLNEKSEITKQTVLVKSFIKLYGEIIYSPLIQKVDSKSVESNFTQNISKTVTDLTSGSIAVASLISIVILVIVAIMIITENTRNISIFGILGYTNKEKIWIFLGIYIPVIILAVFLSIPLVILAISLLNSFLLTSSSLVLPFAISPLNIFISAISIILMFSFIISIIWFSLGRVKPIYALNEKI